MLAKACAALLSVAVLSTSVPSAWAADGAANRAQVLSQAQSAVDASKTRWDAVSASVAAAVADLSSKFDAAAASGGLSGDALPALAALEPAAETLRQFKPKLLADSADLKTKASSQRAATVVSLENLKDEVSLTSASLTDAQSAVYVARVSALASADAASASGVTAEASRLKVRYQDLLASSLGQAVQALSKRASDVAALRQASDAWSQAQAAYAPLAAAAAKFGAADQDKARAAYVALSDAKAKILEKIRADLSAGVANAVSQAPRLAAVRADMDGFVSLQVAGVSSRLSGLYADADKRFFALSKSQSLLASQTGTLARAYDAQGAFRWADWSGTGALAQALTARDDAVGTRDALASLSSTGALAGIPADADAKLQEFYAAELNAARAAVDAYVRAKADKLAAESARIGQLVALRETAFRTDLSTLTDFAVQRARIAAFAAEARDLAAGDTEWPAKAEALVAKYVAAQDANETGILKVRLGARATNMESQVNGALKGVVDRAVSAGKADQVLEKFKAARAKIPALLDKKISDGSRYALLFVVAKIDEFVARIEG